MLICSDFYFNEENKLVRDYYYYYYFFFFIRYLYDLPSAIVKALFFVFFLTSLEEQRFPSVLFFFNINVFTFSKSD